MDEVVASKLISIAVLGICSVICGCLPMLGLAILRRYRGQQTLKISSDSLFFSLCLCFGAGVLLATILCHMIPESLEVWTDMQKDGEVAENNVNVPSILIGIGFFLVYLVEELAHKLMHIKQSRNKVDVEMVQRPSVNSNGTSADSCGTSTPNHEQSDHAGDESSHVHPAEGHSHGAAIASVDSGILVTVILLVALSFHAILEGVAIGAEEKKANVYVMLAAVSAHKYILVFILGLEMLQTTLRLWVQFVFVCTFTGASLLGIGIGIGVLQLTDRGIGEDIALMLMQSLASGTLVYVCFMEVLTRERSREGHAVLRFLVTLIGFAVMSVLVSIIAEPEE